MGLDMVRVTPKRLDKTYRATRYEEARSTIGASWMKPILQPTVVVGEDASAKHAERRGWAMRRGAPSSH